MALTNTERNRRWREKRKDDPNYKRKCRELHKRWREKNRELLRQRSAANHEQRKDDPEYRAIKTKNTLSYYKNNPAVVNASNAERRAVRLKRTPIWLSDEQRAEIKRIYKTCPKGYHVDHIVPLQGKEVSGLHVPWNLQHLPASENCAKGNRL